MQLMILGGGGFIGRVFRRLFRDVYDMTSVDITPVNRDEAGKTVDLTDYASLFSIIDKHKPGGILNLAGKSYHKAQNDVEIYESNLLIQLNLHNAVAELGIKPRIVFCSSSAVYKSSPTAVSETSYCWPPNSYAKAKYMQERIGLSYHPGQCVIIARLFNVIGPFQDKSFFIPALIDRMVRYKRKEIPAVRLKTLKAMRDFIYIDDVCNALGVLLEKGLSGEVYNVCTGEGASIETVIGRLKEWLDLGELPLEAEADYVKEGIDFQVGSNAKMRALGWRAAYDLRTSLSEILREEYEK
jgi:GDP-4-dehydro-6-deoxy-D-mannose reductase